MTKFDEIQKAKHYNSHPSGVECKDIARHLGFDLGNAVKYLWRMHEKHDDPLPDLKKAAFYVEDYIDAVIEDNLKVVELPKVGGSPLSECRQNYNADVQKLIASETDATAVAFWALVLQNPASLTNLQTALAVIQNRIAAEKEKTDDIPVDYPRDEPMTVTAKDFS